MSNLRKIVSWVGVLSGVLLICFLSAYYCGPKSGGQLTDCGEIHIHDPSTQLVTVVEGFRAPGTLQVPMSGLDPRFFLPSCPVKTEGNFNGTYPIASLRLVRDSERLAVDATFRIQEKKRKP